MLATVLAAQNGSAPRDTLDPEASVKQLQNKFKNCEFSAVEKSESDPPHNKGYLIETKMAAWICADATELRMRRRSRMYSKTSAGGDRKAVEDNTDLIEIRWTRGSSRIQSHLYYILGPNKWPDGVIAPGSAKFNAVLDYPKSDDDPIRVWDTALLGKVIGEIAPGISLIDIVSDGGSRGFRFKVANWLSRDQSSVEYSFTSPDYGTSFAKFRKIGAEWLPIRFELQVGADDRAFVPGDGFDARLKNDTAYTDFAESPTGLDRLVSVFEITYSGDVPHRIVKTETRYYRGEQSDSEDVPGLVEKVVSPSPGVYIPGAIISFLEGDTHHVTKVSEIVPCLQVVEWPSSSRSSAADRGAGGGSSAGSAVAAQCGSALGDDA